VMAETAWRLAIFGYRRTAHNESILIASAVRTIPAFTGEIAHARQPFFAFLNLMDVHDPYAPNPALYAQASEDAPPVSTET
jgi:hypothetical protein